MRSPVGAGRHLAGAAAVAGIHHAQPGPDQAERFLVAPAHGPDHRRRPQHSGSRPVQLQPWGPALDQPELADGSHLLPAVQRRGTAPDHLLPLDRHHHGLCLAGAGMPADHRMGHDRQGACGGPRHPGRRSRRPQQLDYPAAARLVHALRPPGPDHRASSPPRQPGHLDTAGPVRPLGQSTRWICLWCSPAGDIHLEPGHRGPGRRALS